MKISEFFHKAKNTSVIWWIVVPYTALFLCFVLVLNYMLHLSNDKLQQEMYTAHENTFNAISANVESMKQSVDSLSQQLAKNTYINSIGAEYVWEDKNIYYDIFNMKEYLKGSLFSQEFLDSIFIFFPRSENMVIDGGIIHAQRSFENQYFSDYMSADKSYESWKTFMSDTHLFEMFRSDSGEIVYLHSVKSGSSNIATIIINIKESFFENLSLGDKEKAGIIIYNHLGDTIFQSGTRKAEKPFSDYGNDSQITGNKEKSYRIFKNDNPRKISFSYYIEEKQFFSSAKALTNTFYRLIILFLILSIGLTLFVSKFHYKSVSGIMSALRKVSPEEDDDIEIKNEYDYIKNSLQSISKKIIKSEVQMKKQTKTKFILSLRDYFTDKSKLELDAITKSFKIDFDFSNYVGALITLKDVDEESWNLSAGDNELIFTATENLFSDFSGDEYQNILIPIDEVSAMIMVGTNNSEKKDILRDMEKIFEEEIKFCDINLSFGFYVHISDVFSELSTFKTIYDKLRSTNYIDTENAVTFLSNIPKNSSYDYSFLDSAETTLRQCLEEADFSGIRKVLDSLFKEKKGTVPGAFSSFINIRVLNVFSSLTKTLETEHVQEYLDYISRINPKNAAYKDFFSLAQYYCEISTGIFKSGVPLSEAVMEYINKHFSDHTLNVNTIGFEFGKTPGYLSGIFKAETGKMLNQYISEVRLQHAKVLLLTDKKIEKISEECGFSDITTFRRTFKRIIGVTPSEFRNKES